MLRVVSWEKTGKAKDLSMGCGDNGNSGVNLVSRTDKEGRF